MDSPKTRYALYCHSCAGECKPESHQSISVPYIGETTYHWSPAVVVAPLAIVLWFGNEEDYEVSRVMSVCLGYRELLQEPIPARNYRIPVDPPTAARAVQDQLALPGYFSACSGVGVVQPYEVIRIVVSRPVTDLGILMKCHQDGQLGPL